ncbi:MAG: hypothetical protein KA191_16620 [Verrucomicrobia bacterium]|jgi:hypothetical protein|nr:hypothetical protein [Verrucomicrobiota bacterium]OQC66433.1 MAG: hypothetical protein BWX48_01621 [Verrucomicrobia bacterium ADurb.Bin006]MDI9381377.1 hypothetical protein [Verrucomicrobiota bacterium]NMD18971.1 hypothetical protein [Verrucomicrobiota bacterium]HOA62409.1 hypothetical protein [Verrucomicrobiota bacterium]
MRRACLLLLVPWLFAWGAAGQGVFVYDQQSSIAEPAFVYGGVLAPDQPPGYGQSFTPSLSAVGFIRMAFRDGRPGNATGASMMMNLRSDSITGPIVGTSLVVDMPEGFVGTADFLFAPEVSVVPHVMYYFEPRIVSGDTWYFDIREEVYNYPGGTWIAMGRPDVSVDCWFREGIIVPEPSSLTLGLFGFAVFACVKRARANGC